MFTAFHVDTLGMIPVATWSVTPNHEVMVVRFATNAITGIVVLLTLTIVPFSNG